MLFTRLYCFCYYVYDTLIVYGIHFMFVCISIFNKNILYLSINNNNNAHKKQQQRRRNRKNLYYYYIYKYNINIKTIIGYRNILIYINQSIMSSKYEGKTSDGGGGKMSESNEDTNSFEVTALTEEPNNCLLQEE